MRLLTAVLIFLVLWPGLAAAQTIVKGKVEDAKGYPLQGSTILFMHSDTIAGGVMTDKKGKFEVIGLPAGEYECKVAMLGYKSQSRRINLTGNVTIPKFVMEEDSRMLGEVSVSADVRDHVIIKAGMETYFLSDRAKNSKNAYDALTEIPRLIVNPINESIKLDNGKSPLILIDGVKKPGYMSVLDPSLIESVDLVDNPSARYSGDAGVQAVLNVKLKRKGIQPYVRGNVSANTLWNFKSFFAGANAELGTSTSSIYVNSQYYQQNISVESYSDSYSGNIHRELYGKSKDSFKSPSFSLGGDNVLSKKHYISYGLKYFTNPTKSNGDSRGIIDDMTSSEHNAVEMMQAQHSKGSYDYFDGNMFYRFKPDKRRSVEVEGNYIYNSGGSDGWRSDKSELYDYYDKIELDNSSHIGKLNIGYTDRLTDVHTLEFGSNTNHTARSIDDRLDRFPVYKYKHWREYLYAGIDNNRSSGRFNFSVSLGLDMVFTNADGKKNHYVTLVPTVSLAQTIGNQGRLSLMYKRDRSMATTSQLNPRNVSTDSLTKMIGNPFLSPEMTDMVTMELRLPISRFTISPYVQYVYASDEITRKILMDGNICVNTYENFGHRQMLQAGTTVNYNLPFGNLMAMVYYQKDYIKGMPFSGNGFDVMLSGNFWYKNISVMIFYGLTPKSYSVTSMANGVSSSNLNLRWNINDAWTVNLGAENWLSPKRRSKTWVVSDGYNSYSSSLNTTFSPKVTIGVSFNFQNKVKWNWRNKKMFYEMDKDLQDLQVN